MSVDRESLLSAFDADPLASLRVEAVADLAFGSLTVGATQVEGGHLAILSTDALELDLNDPLQRQFGDYELLELIGEGGMGVVYRARQRSLERDVAVKLLAAGPWASKIFIERFRREAQNAARMQHPNIVAIYEVGSAEELHFFSMRLIDGPSLAAQLKTEKRFSPRRAAAFVRTVAEAVDYAHRLGVLHLDLKPANVLLDENGTPHVADFGLARRLESGLVADNHEVSGTPSYMAPEQATAGSQSITPATDIWGLGAILYELVIGTPPFLGDSPQATLKLVVGGTMRRPREALASIPRDLEAIIEKCMCRNVAERYVTARALSDDLARFLENRAVQARPLSSLQRFWRWAQRQPYLAVVGLLFSLSLIVGIVGVTTQWLRAERNAQVSNERLRDSRRVGALQLERDSKGFAALPALIANVEDAERGGQPQQANVERHAIRMILDQGVVLLDRMRVPNASTASPFAAELSPDGTKFAIAMSDLTVHWFDTHSLRELGHVDLLGLPDSTDAPEIPALLRFVDEDHLRVTLDWIDFYTSPQESNSYVIDLANASVMPFPSEFAELSDANFSADGKFAILRNRSQQIQVWQVQPWRALSPLTTQTADQEILVLGRDARYVMALGRSNRYYGQTLKFYDPRTLRLTRNIPLSQSEGLSAWAESNDGKRFAFGDYQGRVFVLEVASGLLRQLPTPIGREVTWVAFSEDDAWLAAVRWDGAAFAFDVDSGNAVNAGQMQHDFELRRVRIDHKEHLLIASGLGKSALWRLPQPSPTGLPPVRMMTSPMRPAVAGPYSLGFCERTGMLITAETDGEVRLWRVPHSPVLDAHTARFLPGMLQFDGKHIADVAYDSVRIFALDGSNSTDWIKMPQPLGFAELIDSARTLITTSGTALTVFDARTMAPRFKPIDLGATPMRLVASAESNVVVLAFPVDTKQGFSERIESFDLHTGTALANETVRGPLRQFELSAAGDRLLAVGSRQLPTQVLDARSLKALGTYHADADKAVVWAAFAANAGELDVLERRDDESASSTTLKAWTVPGGTVRTVSEMKNILATGVIATRQNPFVAGRDVDVIGVGTSEERRLLSPTRDLSTAAVALSHDGRVIAHAYKFGVQLYDAGSGAAIGIPLEADLFSVDLIAQLAFSEDDTQLLARTLHGQWIVWPTRTDERTTDAIETESSRLNAEANDPTLSGESFRGSANDPGEWRAPPARPQIAALRNVDGEPIPQRAPDILPQLIDLTALYNTAPDTILNTAHAIVPSMNLLPLGVARIQGVDYDVRGMDELRQSTSVDRTAFNDTAKNIAIPDGEIAAFHVLMLAGVFTPLANGEPQVRLRIHYRDGSTEDVLLRSGYELPADKSQDEHVPYGWVWGDYQRLTGEQYQSLLSNPRLVNPHPERAIKSIDLDDVSTVPSSPAFFAITAEPVIGNTKSGISTSKPEKSTK